MNNFNLQSQLRTMKTNILNMTIFSVIKTNDPILDGLITTFVLYLVTYLFEFINIYNIKNFFFNTRNLHFQKFFYNLQSIEYEGKICSSTNFYDSRLHNSTSFSDRFKALWTYIISNIDNNDTIKSIKEYSFSNPNDSKNNSRDLGIYIVNQENSFLISKEYEIYAYTLINTETSEADKNEETREKGKMSRIDKIVIQLFSYKSNVEVIKNFVENITEKYISDIEDRRDNKRYLYNLVKNKYEESMTEMWSEVEFSSTRSFKNLFFKSKSNLISKLDFFLQNKEWYFNKGIPYSLGIGLHGPPGTGKTSLIKAIANYTGRHIVTISLKIVKSKQQLERIFFEDRYNSDNKKGSIGFNKKIMVFEDIDCMGDIVKARDKQNKSKTGLGTQLNFDELTPSSKVNVGDLLETIAASDKTSTKTAEFPKFPIDEEPITLDDILNLWDGIRETPGRIMIISSNYYSELDHALIRPGRIDLSIELSFLDHETISEIYQHLFDEPIDKDKLKIVQENFYSPAEIINIYTNEERCSKRFMERLCKNSHV